MARSLFFQTPELYPNFPHTSTLVLLKSLTRNQTSCWEMSLMLLALSMELFCWLVTVSCPCLGLRGFGYQNPLISNRYNFMKCTTSLPWEQERCQERDCQASECWQHPQCRAVGHLEFSLFPWCWKDHPKSQGEVLGSPQSVSSKVSDVWSLSCKFYFSWNSQKY